MTHNHTTGQISSVQQFTVQSNVLAHESVTNVSFPPRPFSAPKTASQTPRRRPSCRGTVPQCPTPVVHSQSPSWSLVWRRLLLLRRIHTTCKLPPTVQYKQNRIQDHNRWGDKRRVTRQRNTQRCRAAGTPKRVCSLQCKPSGTTLNVPI